MNEIGWKVIRGGRVLDFSTGEAPLLDVLVRDAKILDLRPPGAAVPEQAEVVNAEDKLLIPGLINAHTHGHCSLGKGWGDRWTLELLLNAGPWIRGRRTLEDKKLAARLNAAEMVLKGCTACYDLYFEFPLPSCDGLAAVAEGYAEVGVRAVIAPMMADLSLYEALPGLLEHLPESLRRQTERFRYEPCAKSLAVSRDLLRNWPSNRDQARPALAPTIPFHCTDVFLGGCRDLAKEYGAGLHMHLAESKVQVLAGKRRYGESATAHLDGLGLLGENFVGAHCVWLDDDDIRRMADRGCGIAHQPGCNLRIGSGVAPVRVFLDQGITVGVGTDGSNASDHQNMFESLRMAANVSRLADADYERWISAAEALGMATEGSARLLGFDGLLGRIAPGRLADILFLDLHSPNYLPLNNPLHQVVNCEDGSAVHSVMIGGRLVLSGREFVDFDYARLRLDVEAAMTRLGAATADNRELVMQLEKLVGGYCVGLARQPHPLPRTLF